MDHIKPYEGQEPYIFISYAHANAPAVLEVVGELVDRGFRVWYDDGIEVGSEWQEYIAGHLAGASLMISFISNAYIASDNCRKEMSFALSRRIPTVNIFLEQTRLTPGMELQIGNLFALMKYTMDEDVFYSKLFAAPQLDTSLCVGGAVAAPKKRRKRRTGKTPVDMNVEAKRLRKKTRKRRLALALVLVLLAGLVALGIVGHFTGLTERLLIKRAQTEIPARPGDTEAVFTEPLLEAAARAWCKKAEEPLTVSDLAGLGALYLRGDRFSFTPFSDDETTDDGSLRDLSDLRWFTGLRRLVIEEEPLSSLESLPVSGVEYLTLRSCRLSSLQGVGSLIRLRELETAGCPVRALGDLRGCLQLRRLSLRDAAVADYSAVKPLIRLAEVELSGSAINDLAPVLGLSSLTDASFIDCDLRGSFFKRFDRESGLVSLSLTDCKLNSTVNLEDFTSLTTLTLIRSGETLDWSVLAELPALQTVRADAATADALRDALAGTGVNLSVFEEPS